MGKGRVGGQHTIFYRLLVPSGVGCDILLLLRLLMLSFEEIVEELELCYREGGEGEEDQEKERCDALVETIWGEHCCGDSS